MKSGAPQVVCPQGHRCSPCTQACQAPERCAAWGKGAAPAPHAAAGTPTTTLAASALHLAVAAAAVGALVFIVRTAAGV